MNPLKGIVVSLLFLVSVETFAQQTTENRILAGYILTQQNELFPNGTIIVRSSAGELRTK